MNEKPATPARDALPLMPLRHSPDDGDVAGAVRRFIVEDAVGQLRRREGRMAQLGSEGDAVKLDWVEGVARLLQDDGGLEGVEAEARDLWRRGIRHVIWAGMGGSVITVHVLIALGLCQGGADGVTIYPLDSTDPAALNSIVRRIAQSKNVALPHQDARAEASPTMLRALLGDVLMVGVSMGLTSEEPITHLQWFVDLLVPAGLAPAEHLLIMTLPDSYLDRFARDRGVTRRPLQLDGGTGTGGRMSAPATRVFLLPAALSLVGSSQGSGGLRRVLTRAWAEYNLDLAASDPAAHPFVRLAAALSAASVDGACRLLLDLPRPWRPLTAWIEQLMEESLGKGGKGIVVFDDQPLNPRAPGYRPEGTVRVRVVAEAEAPGGDADVTLVQPSLAAADPSGRLAGDDPSGRLAGDDPSGRLAGDDPSGRLVAAAASFLGWQLAMALFGYLHGITFAGQPAVENYKARARVLRARDAPLQTAIEQNQRVTESPLTLLAPPGQGSGGDPAARVIAALRHMAPAGDARRLGYLDITMNGELPAGWAPVLHAALRALGPATLGVPARLRRAPAAYHSTEQSEMDGPPDLVSLRLITRGHEQIVLGVYTDIFLQAQAVGAWQAMIEQGRACFLLIVDEDSARAGAALGDFFQTVVRGLA